MDLTLRVKEHIDSLTYEELHHGWHHAPPGDRMFQGPSGEYWQERLLSVEAAGLDHVALSQKAKWDGW